MTLALPFFVSTVLVVVTYWYFLWRTARRWNGLLYRSGKAADPAVMRKPLKLVVFVWNGSHRDFNDAELSRLVQRSRAAFVGAMLMLLVVWPIGVVSGFLLSVLSIGTN